MELQGQWAELLPRAKQALIDVVDSGRYILGPQVKAFEEEAAAYARRGPRHRRGQRHRRPRARAARGRRRARRRGDLPVVHLLRHGRGDRRGRRRARCSPTSTPTTTSIRRRSRRRSRRAPARSSSSTCSATRADLAGAARALRPRRHRAAGGRGPGDRRRARRAPCGSLGDVATFSFFPTKNLSTLRRRRPRSRRRRRRRGRHVPARCASTARKRQADVQQIGYNSRLDELQAAVLRVFLRGLDGWNAGRQAAADALPRARPRRARERCRPTAASTTCTWRAWPSATRVVGGAARRRHRLRRLLRARRCTCSRCSPTCRERDLPETEPAPREGLALPMFPTLTEEQQREVVAAVRVGPRDRVEGLGRPHERAARRRAGAARACAQARGDTVEVTRATSPRPSSYRPPERPRADGHRRTTAAAAGPARRGPRPAGRGAAPLGARPRASTSALAHGSTDQPIVGARCCGFRATTMFDYEYAACSTRSTAAWPRAVLVPEAIPPERLRALRRAGRQARALPGPEGGVRAGRTSSPTRPSLAGLAPAGELLAVLRPPPELALYHRVREPRCSPACCERLRPTTGSTRWCCRAPRRRASAMRALGLDGVRRARRARSTRRASWPAPTWSSRRAAR